MAPSSVPYLLAVALFGCGDGAPSGGAGDASGGTDRGRELGDAAPLDAATDSAPDLQATTDAADSSAPDGTGDTSSCVDGDGDGHFGPGCGGDDCDDNEAQRHGGLAEGCDYLDNDCDGHVNNGLSCAFFAQSEDQLFAIDPFRETARIITSVPALWDLDTHPNTNLYGISSSSLYRLDQTEATWQLVGSLGAQVVGDPNGLAIDNDGRAYITSGSTLYTVNLDTGAATPIGGMGGVFESSGDCVVNKDNTLYMSSRHDLATDWLIRVDGQTGQGTAVGPIGFTDVYGLTAAWGYLFGLTSRGEIIEIDEETGEGRLLAAFGAIWYGAASTPSR